jgi:hypothetical protein
LIVEAAAAEWRPTSGSSSTPTSDDRCTNHRHRLRLLPVLVAVLVGIGSCSADHGRTADDREIAIYAAVVRVLITAPAGNPRTTAPGRPVFVVAADPHASISLEVQAGVADAVHSLATIRFLDSRSEAIDTADPRRPVHDGGILITLGSIPAGDTAVAVDAQRYERIDAAATYRISLRRVGARWNPVTTNAG